MVREMRDSVFHRRSFCVILIVSVQGGVFFLVGCGVKSAFSGRGRDFFEKKCISGRGNTSFVDKSISFGGESAF